MTDDYIATVHLLLNIAPTVFRSGLFAMKGGTALNLFVQDMPRLSVDIDVVFIDHVPDREAALAAIRAELRTIQQSLQDRGLDARLPANAHGDEVRLSVRSADAQGAQSGRRELPVSRHQSQDRQRHRRPESLTALARAQES